MPSVFERLRNLFGGRKSNVEMPLPMTVEETRVNAAVVTRLRDVEMPDTIKQLYNDLFKHVWDRVGFPGFDYDNYIKIMRLNPNNKNFKTFNEYINSQFINGNDTEFRRKLNRLNSLLGSEYSIKNSNDLLNFISEKKYPTEMPKVERPKAERNDVPPLPVLERRKEIDDKFESDVPEYLNKNRISTPRDGFNPDRPSFMQKGDNKNKGGNNLSTGNTERKTVPLGETKEERIERLKWQIDLLSMPGSKNETPEEKDRAVRMIDYCIKELEKLGVKVENPTKPVSEPEPRKEEMPEPVNELGETKEQRIERLKWQIEILSAPGRKNEPAENKEVAAKMIENAIKELEELGVKVENPIKSTPEIKQLESNNQKESDSSIAKTTSEIKSKKSKTKKNYIVRNLQLGEEVIDINQNKDVLVDYSNISKLNDKIANIKAKSEQYRKSGNIDLADECDVLVEDLTNFRDEIASIKREKQRAYRDLNKSDDERKKNKSRARLDSLAIKQRRLEEDRRVLMEMEQILDSEISQSKGKSK